MGLYIVLFGAMIIWKVRQNARDRKDKRDLQTDEIAMRAETRQHRENETEGRANLFSAAEKFKNNDLKLDEGRDVTRFKLRVVTI